MLLYLYRFRVVCRIIFMLLVYIGQALATNTKLTFQAVLYNLNVRYLRSRLINELSTYKNF